MQLKKKLIFKAFACALRKDSWSDDVHNRPSCRDNDEERLESRGVSRGSCKGWQPLPNGNWRPCDEGAGAPAFISSRRVSQFGSIFRRYIGAFQPAKRPSDTIRCPFPQRRRPHKQIRRPSRQHRRPSGTKRRRCARDGTSIVEMAPIPLAKMPF